MKFKFAHLRDEFPNLHPETWRAAMALDHWSIERKFPEVVVTCVDRSLADQKEIYGDHRFSWHLVRCAVDIRNSHYSIDQLGRVLEFLKDGRDEGWEILNHDVGKGSHIHVGFRDPEWRARFKDRTILHEDHQA